MTSALDPTNLPTRPPRAEELARLESARGTLTTAAWWARVIAYYIPAVLSAVVVVLAVSQYPGTWFAKCLMAIVDTAAVVSVFTLPILLTGTGRVMLAQARFKKDAERGFVVARVRGDVVWGKRPRGYVALVNGERLFSPFFTQFSAVASYWEHFDQLEPGAYLFDILPSSRLVLGAEPVAPAARHPDQSPAREALAFAFRNRLADLDLNRQGRASARQRAWLAVRNVWLLVLLPLVAVPVYQMAHGAGRAPQGTPWFAQAFVFALLAFLFFLILRVVADVIEGRVEEAVGIVTVTFGRADATGHIGPVRVSLSSAQGRALQGPHRRRVFYFRRSRVVAGAEPA